MESTRDALLERARTLTARVRMPVTEADWQGKVAVITGGSRGLGLLIARELVAAGCKIAICSRDEVELREGQRDLEARGGEVFTGVCDITDQTQVSGFIADVTRRFGRVDILVNNAGIIQVGPVLSMELSDFREAMDVMFWGTVYPTVAVLPQMVARRQGWIVNITSIGGKISVPHLLPYSSAKFAAVGFSEGLRAELARDGVSVTTIVPGLMRTGSHQNALFKGDREHEYTWFSLGASLPVVSMDAERAAHQIVEAARRGRAEEILGMPAAVGARLHGLVPGLTADVLGLVNRILPPDTSTAQSRGGEIDRRMGSKLLDSLTALGRSAAKRFNE